MRLECRGHTSFVTHIDWSADGEFIQSSSGDYELLYWQAPYSDKMRDRHMMPGSPRARLSAKGLERRRWEQSRDMSDLADCDWHTWTLTLGFPVMGIWPAYSDGTDVNAVDRSPSKLLLATGEDTKEISLFRFPCLKGAKSNKAKGHMSHVMCVRFAHVSQSSAALLTALSFSGKS